MLRDKGRQRKGRIGGSEEGKKRREWSKFVEFPTAKMVEIKESILGASEEASF